MVILGRENVIQARKSQFGNIRAALARLASLLGNGLRESLLGKTVTWHPKGTNQVSQFQVGQVGAGRRIRPVPLKPTSLLTPRESVAHATFMYVINVLEF
ncbi:hypothetical protein RRG08_055096 [Elysia crispata]|uniref:Uncharacterized protein n=1 Tax=Elysia crispata TaxID=231223 RepID=A0AAE1AZ50_9GAST|nr:hypothetical protein RRG08_055096 [Elysia crispata]